MQTLVEVVEGLERQVEEGLSVDTMHVGRAPEAEAVTKLLFTNATL